MGGSQSKSSKSTAKKRVVVIGGSYAGNAAVYLLDASFDVTWIERRPCFVHKMMVRTSTKSDWIPAGLVRSDNMLKNGKRIHGDVTRVDCESRTVHYHTTDGDSTVEYDYLIIGTGATSTAPVEPRFASLESSTMDDITLYFKSVVSTIANHKNIVVLGGGPVGCEMAGEIKATHPSHSVTIVNKPATLCSNMGIDQGGSDKIQKALEKFGIKVVLGKAIELTDEQSKQSLIEFTESKSYPDLHLDGITLIVNCTGATPNTQFLTGSEYLDDLKLIKVNKYLQVNNSVFAIGDCNDVKEPKLFSTAGTKKFMFGFSTGQADIVAKNISALESQTALTPYKPNTGKARVIIPIGSKGGVTVNVPGFFAKLKAKDYFAPNMWKFNRQIPPKMPK